MDTQNSRKRPKQSNPHFSVSDYIEIISRHGPEFFSKAQALIAFVRDLNLPEEKYNHLVRLITDAMTTAEEHALMQGFCMGLNSAGNCSNASGCV